MPNTTSCPTILALNALHGDSSAALFADGQLVSAVEEERFNRIKHWAGLPAVAAVACTDGLQPGHIAISRDPRANLHRKLFRAYTALYPFVASVSALDVLLPWASGYMLIASATRRAG